MTEPLLCTADVVVVGGGAAGLSTAYWLRAEHDVDVVVLEASERAGGKVTTRELAGLPVDTGPDAFLSRAADLGELVSRLGLRDAVVGPLPGGAFVWSRGHLRPIPAGGFFGIPDRVLPLVRSRLLSPAGVLRAGLDLVLPRTELGDDPSVADVVRPRLGDEAFDRLVQPLLGGVHAGSAERLSAVSTVPEVLGIARSGRSLVLSLRNRRRSAPKPSMPPAPPLVSLAGGMSRLIDGLVEAVGPERVLTSSPALSLRRTANGWTITTPSAVVEAREVVLAAPAYAAADLVATELPALADELRGIEYADVANVTLALRRSEVGDLVGTGFLVPPVEGDLVVGCTWLTSKWPHLVGTDTVLVRCMVGRDGDDRWTSMDDTALVASVRSSLRRMMNLVAEPTDVLVQRWPAAMPQYVVGHAARLERLDALSADGPHLTGAAYRGSGLAGCVGDARRTAASVAAALAARPTRPDVTDPEPSLQGAAR